MVVAGALPLAFALVAVIGLPKPAARARAIGCDDTRTATPSAPQSSGAKPSRAGSTSVSGPGQNASANRRAEAETSRAIENAIAVSPAINPTGRSASRAFAANSNFNAPAENG